MWDRQGGAKREASQRGSEALEEGCRRAYYRVTGLLPIRVSPIDPADVDAEIFDLSMPDPSVQPIAEEGEVDSPLMERLRRLEEKLDLLLGQAKIEAPRQLAGRDRKSVVFSGSGLALEVDWRFRRGDPYKVEILLPPPYSRVVRCIAEAVADAPPSLEGEGTRSLALAIKHMEDEERDALVAYSYDLQRFELRGRNSAGMSV